MLKDKDIQSVSVDHCIKESLSSLDERNVDGFLMVQGDELSPSSLSILEGDAQKITNILIELVANDRGWWDENIESLASQPLDSLKLHLTRFQDRSLSSWNFKSKNDISCSILEPLEALTWLAGICRLDRILIGVLPREFVDQYELQWKVLALYWV